MCAEYEIRTSQKHIEEVLGRSLQNETGEGEWDLRVKFTVPAPLVELGPHGPRLVKRVFPARPFPNARLSSTDDADPGAKQVRRIYHLPTWNQGFRTERCLAVMTDFFEPVYWGGDAGSVMRFRPPNAKVFLVAAIGIKPQVPPTGKRNGFALLTHTATKQMLAYHHRLVVVLPPEAAWRYLNAKTDDHLGQAFDTLVADRFTGALDATPERRMAKGWEKRADSHKAALVEEIEYTALLHEEGVQG